MSVSIKIPSLGESIYEVTIGSFLKQEGSTVQEGDEILEIETDKVNQVLYAPASGVIHYEVQEGNQVQVSQTIGYIDTETTSQPQKKEPPAKKEPTKEEPIKPDPLLHKKPNLSSPTSAYRRCFSN